MMLRTMSAGGRTSLSGKLVTSCKMLADEFLLAESWGVQLFLNFRISRNGICIEHKDTHRLGINFPFRWFCSILRT